MTDTNNPSPTTFPYWNYRTQTFDSIDGFDLTDETALAYMPQNPAVEGLFKVHRMLGKTTLESMVEALEACLRAWRSQENKSGAV